MRTIEKLSNKSIDLTEFYPPENTLMWEKEKITLIKKKCHEYDKEWRMLTKAAIKAPVFIEWIPCGLILGLKMDAAEEQLIISLASQAGISKIYKSFINSNGDLDAKEISFVI